MLDNEKKNNHTSVQYNASINGIPALQIVNKIDTLGDRLKYFCFSTSQLFNVAR